MPGNEIRLKIIADLELNQASAKQAGSDAARALKAGADATGGVAASQGRVAQSVANVGASNFAVEYAEALRTGGYPAARSIANVYKLAAEQQVQELRSARDISGEIGRQQRIANQMQIRETNLSRIMDNQAFSTFRAQNSAQRRADDFDFREFKLSQKFAERDTVSGIQQEAAGGFDGGGGGITGRDFMSGGGVPPDAAGGGARRGGMGIFSPLMRRFLAIAAMREGVRAITSLPAYNTERMLAGNDPVEQLKAMTSRREQLSSGLIGSAINLVEDPSGYGHAGVEFARRAGEMTDARTKILQNQESLSFQSSQQRNLAGPGETRRALASIDNTLEATKRTLLESSREATGQIQVTRANQIAEINARFDDRVSKAKASDVFNNPQVYASHQMKIAADRANEIAAAFSSAHDAITKTTKTFADMGDSAEKVAKLDKEEITYKAGITRLDTISQTRANEALASGAGFRATLGETEHGAINFLNASIRDISARTDLSPADKAQQIQEARDYYTSSVNVVSETASRAARSRIAIRNLRTEESKFASSGDRMGAMQAHVNVETAGDLADFDPSALKSAAEWNSIMAKRAEALRVGGIEVNRTTAQMVSSADITRFSVKNSPIATQLFANEQQRMIMLKGVTDADEVARINDQSFASAAAIRTGNTVSGALERQHFQNLIAQTNVAASALTGNASPIAANAMAIANNAQEEVARRKTGSAEDKKGIPDVLRLGIAQEELQRAEFMRQIRPAEGSLNLLDSTGGQDTGFDKVVSAIEENIGKLRADLKGYGFAQ